MSGAAPALDEWSPPLLLSSPAHYSRIQYNWGWAIDVDGGGAVHAAWLEATSADPGLGAGRVMYSRSTDDGRTWSMPVPLSGALFTGHPKVAASGSHVYVAWHGSQDGGGVSRVYIVHSATQGSSWDPPGIVSDEPAAAWPSLNACGDSVHVVWGDARSGVSEIQLRSSTDSGRSWTPVRQVSSPDGRSSWVPTVACWGPVVHVAWSDERHNVDEKGNPYDCGIAHDSTACREEEYYRRSTDFGNTWDAELRLTADPRDAPRPSWAPSIAACQDSVHLVFFDGRAGRFQVYYKRSTGAGAALSWEAERLISPDTTGATFHARPVLAALGSALHVVWFGITPGVGVDVRYAGSRDGGASFGVPAPLTSKASPSETHPSVAVSPHGSAHVIWCQADSTGVDRIFHRALRHPAAVRP